MAAHSRRRSVGTASSLFGANDASDFFAAISSTSTSPPTNNGAIHQAQSTGSAAADLFGGASHLSSLNAADQYATQMYANPDYFSGTNAPADTNGASYSNDYGYYDPNYSNGQQGYQAEGWYDDNGQWHEYPQEYPQTQSSYQSSSWSVPTASTASSQTAYSQQYNDYTRYTPAPSEAQYGNYSTTASTAQYQAYSPAPLQHTPGGAATSASPYDPYNPKSSAQNEVNQQKHHVTAPSSTKNPFDIAPPKPKAAPPPRPTTYNAYDPPLPPSKPAQTSQFLSRTGSSSTSHSNAYTPAAAATELPPPPPAKASKMSSMYDPPMPAVVGRSSVYTAPPPLNGSAMNPYTPSSGYNHVPPQQPLTAPYAPTAVPSHQAPDHQDFYGHSKPTQEPPQEHQFEGEAQSHYDTFAYNSQDTGVHSQNGTGISPYDPEGSHYNELTPEAPAESEDLEDLLGKGKQPDEASSFSSPIAPASIPLPLSPPPAGDSHADVNTYSLDGFARIASPKSHQTSPERVSKANGVLEYGQTDKTAPSYPAVGSTYKQYEPLHASSLSQSSSYDPYRPSVSSVQTEPKASNPTPAFTVPEATVQQINQSEPSVPSVLSSSYVPPPPRDAYAPNAATDSPYAPRSSLSSPPPPPPSWGSPPSNPYVPSSRTARADSTSTTASYQPSRIPPPAQPLVPSATWGAPPPASAAVDPYAPRTTASPPISRHTRQQGSGSEYGSSDFKSRFQYPSAPAVGLTSEPSSYEPQSALQNYIALPPAPTGAYAPSPSLLGTNDPLGRAQARVPVISFGFGGKLLTCFHNTPASTGGFDVSLSARPVTTVQMRELHKIIPSSALDSSSIVFPGPLFSDPGSPTAGIVLTGTSSATKTKKAAVVKYLEERIEEIDRGLGYISTANDRNSHRSKAEGKLILVKLLKIMVENDGKLNGTPEIDASVRAALVPRLDKSSLSSATDSVANITPFGFATAPMDTLGADGYSSSNQHDTPLAVYKLQPSFLDRLQDFLLRGERKQAFHYALDEKMWAHALLIASNVDKESWKEVVGEFIRSELGIFSGHGAESSDIPSSNGRESLRVAYSLFAGQGSAAVQELLPPKQLAKAGSFSDSLLPPTVAATPLTPNFPSTAVAASIPVETLAKWQETAAMILANQSNGDSAALITLGDYLLANHWVEAAHCCYLLSPQSSLFGGVGTPSPRVTLLGSESPATRKAFPIDVDAMLFSEIAEFALSLTPVAKGQDSFCGVSHLQPYRLLRAFALAELGQIQSATRYCDAISTALRSSVRGSAYYTPAFLDQLKELSDRLNGAPHLDKSGSWISRKVAKPSLDSIGGWLGGRVTKFIEGDEATDAPANEPPKAQKQDFVGPFSHYSAISSAITSTSPSPSPSINNMRSTASPPPRRSGSAMALRPTQNPHIQIDRASSAMDHLRPVARRSSPVPRIASASAATTTFSQAGMGISPVARFKQQHGGFGESTNNFTSTNGTAQTGSIREDQPTQDTGSWWGQSYPDESNGATPTATTFFKVEEPISEGNFISLMDNYDPVPRPSPSPAHRSHVHEDQEFDDEDDLGLGNSSTKSKAPTPDAKEVSASSSGSTSATAQNDVTSAPTPAPPAPETKPETKPSGGATSWIRSWWSKNNDSPAPIKASLGEETSFYYDKELKRWVNKKAGAESAAPTPPPPPPRAQTASPSRAAIPASTPPPPRPASAIDLSTSPPRKAPRVRSSLIPHDDENSGRSASSTPPPSNGPPRSVSGTPPPPSSGLSSPIGGLAPPPVGRPKSQASRRSVRSRYVDVFQPDASS